jgi:hypothetical protein
LISSGIGSLIYHIDYDYIHNMEGMLCRGNKKHIDKIMGQYENMFGCKPHEYASLLEKGNHLKVNCSDELDEEGIKRYQTLISCLHKAILLGRFNICTQQP